ncbi:MAG TPA: sensor histidine kinase, partial [Acidimicrobiia bacterium]|nr:sensor histidine kinase [Acidimicrobiia bacterium]
HVQLEPTILAGVPARLERAVSNLIDNAIKYSPPGEPVEIRLQGKELVVRDHGPGIAAEDLPYVFDRFYRAVAVRSLPGSGLGLSIVRDAAQAAGGEVTAANAPDGGAVFTLRLPVAAG